MAGAPVPEVIAIERAAVLAQQRVALLSTVLMWALFQQVNPLRAAATGGNWFNQSYRLMRATVLMLRWVSKSQYRLTRALDTGSTVGWRDSTGSVKLGDLRQDFVDSVEATLQLGSQKAPGGAGGGSDDKQSSSGAVGQYGRHSEAPVGSGSIFSDEDVSYFDELLAEMQEEFSQLEERLKDRDTRSAGAVRDLAGHDNPSEDSMGESRDYLDELMDDLVNSWQDDNDQDIEIELDLSDDQDEDFWEHPSYHDDDIEDDEDDDRFTSEPDWDEDDRRHDEASRREREEAARDDAERNIREFYLQELENRVHERVNNVEEMREAQDDIKKIADSAGLDASAWLEKLAREQGRIMAEKAAARDNKLLMAARKTGSNPCAFCAMLASRGYVYTGTTAGGTTRKRSRAGNEVDSSEFGTDGFRAYHPNCQCSVVYRWQDNPVVDTTAERLQELWKQAGSLPEFRKMLDQIRRENGGSLRLYLEDDSQEEHFG